MKYLPIAQLATDSYEDLPKELQAAINDRFRNVELMLENLEDFKALDEARRLFYPSDLLYCGTYHATIYPRVLKFADIAPLLRHLASKGYHQTLPPSINRDAGTISYTLGFINIYATLITTDDEDPDADVCRRVIVGYQDVAAPEPIYKIICKGTELVPPPTPTEETPDEYTTTDPESVQDSVVTDGGQV